MVNFEAVKGAARTTAQTPCTSRNQGLKEVITNVQYSLTCCIGAEYWTCCNVMVVFLTSDERAMHIPGDHAAYNCDLCMVSVTKALHASTSMIIGDLEVSLVGASNVAAAIDLRLKHQINGDVQSYTNEGQRGGVQGQREHGARCFEQPDNGDEGI